MKIHEDQLTGFVIIGSLIILILLALIGFTLFSRSAASGVLAGGCIALMNFFWQRSVLQRVLILQPDKPAGYVSIRYALRLFITAVLLFLIITSGYFTIAGLLVGLSVVVIMIMFFTIFCSIQHKGD